MQCICADAQVNHKSEVSVCLLAFLVVALDAKQVRWVDCDEDAAISLPRQDLATYLRDGDRLPNHPARCGGAERHDEIGIDNCTLAVEPPAAALDLVRVGSLVEAPLAALLEFEVLY